LTCKSGLRFSVFSLCSRNCGFFLSSVPTHLSCIFL
jgi:hypothetical protein